MASGNRSCSLLTPGGLIKLIIWGTSRKRSLPLSHIGCTYQFSYSAFYIVYVFAYPPQSREKHYKIFIGLDSFLTNFHNRAAIGMWTTRGH